MNMPSPKQMADGFPSDSAHTQILGSGIFFLHGPNTGKREVASPRGRDPTECSLHGRAWMW